MVDIIILYDVYFIHLFTQPGTQSKATVVTAGYLVRAESDCSASVTVGVKTEMSLVCKPVGKRNGVFPMLHTQSTGLVTPWSPLPNASITQSCHELSAISLAWLYERATPKSCRIKVLLLFQITFPSNVPHTYHINALNGFLWIFRNIELH